MNMMRLGVLDRKKQVRNTRQCPDPSSLEDMVHRLRRDEIESLRLGWKESDFLQSKRSVLVLERALKLNKSVKRVSIGWKYRDRDVLIKVLRLIGQECNLESFQLVVNDWLPEYLLRNFFESQTNLMELDLRGVRVMRRNAVGQLCCSNSHINTTGKVCDHSIVSKIIVQMWHHTHLTVLHLGDCDLDDTQAVVLADFLHIRGGIAELSLRQNRKLRSRGLSVLCQAPIMRRLDLSLCDIDGDGAKAIALSIARRRWPLEELLLCGNYRMEMEGLLALVQPSCCKKLLKLDLSYADIGTYHAILVLKALQKLDGYSILQHIVLHGTNIANPEVVKELCTLIEINTSLRSISVDDPDARRYMCVSDLRLVLEAARHNYEIEALNIDTRNSTFEERNIWKELRYIFRLNTTGRRVLRPKPSHTETWLDVLGKFQMMTEGDMDILYSFIRMSPERVGNRFR